MEAGNILVKSEMIALADEAIEELERNVSDITTVNQGLFNAMFDDIITGTLGDAVSDHLMGLIELNSSFANLMNLDIQAYNELKNILSTLSGENEILDGAAIANDIYDCEVNIASIQLQLNWNSRTINPFFSALIAGATSYVVYLQGRLAWYNRRLNKLREKQALYDSIDAATANLFNQNDELRSVIREGYTYISTEWNGDVCVIPQGPMESAAWRTELARINEEYISQYSEQYYTIDENGNLIINWDEVSLLYHSDPDTVNPYQYIAVARMYPLMSDEEIETAFEYAQCETGNSNCPYEISETFGNTIAYYQFDSLCNGNLEFNNDLTRSTAMGATYRYVLESNVRGDMWAVDFRPHNYNSDTGAEDTVSRYEVRVDFVDVFTPIESFAGAGGDPLLGIPGGTAPGGATITVWSYDNGLGFLSNSIQSSNGYMSDFTEPFDIETQDIIAGGLSSLPELNPYFQTVQGNHRIWNGRVVPLWENYIYPIAEPLSSGASLYGEVQDVEEDVENAQNAQSVVDLNQYSLISQGMHTGGCLVVVNADDTGMDQVYVSNVVVDGTALQADIVAYNDDHPGSEITYVQFIDDYNEFIEDGADVSLLSPDSEVETDNSFVSFMRWTTGPNA